MPVIRNYQRRVSAPGATPQRQVSANDFGAAQGRALRQVGQGVSNVASAIGKRKEQQEISDLNAKLNTVNGELGRELDTISRTAKPGDKKVFEEYNIKVGESLSKLGEDLSSRRAQNYLTEMSAKIRTQKLSSSVNAQSDLAGAKAVQDVQTSLNQGSSAVLMDPTSVGLSKEIYSSGIDQLVDSEQISRKVAIEMKAAGSKKLSKSAVRGWIKLNPEHAKNKLKSGDFGDDIDGDLRVQLMGEADQAIRAVEVEKERKRQQAKRIKKEKDGVIQNEFLEKMNKNELTTKDILGSSLEAFGTGSKDQFIDMLAARNRTKPPTTNPASFRNAFDRIHLPDGDPEKITNENDINDMFIKGDIQYQDLQRLRKEVQGTGTAQGKIDSDLKKTLINSAKRILTKSDPLLGIVDPEGDLQYQAFLSFFMDEFQKEKDAGKSTKDLLDPTSKDYMGSIIDSYTRTSKQKMNSMINNLRSGRRNTKAGLLSTDPVKKKPARNAGESHAEYLKRIGL